VGHGGFSLVGAIFLAALFVPNIAWTRAQPAGYDPSGERPALRRLERAGQVLTTTAALVFADTSLRAWSAWSWWLVAGAALMVTYEACWVRYFRGPHTLAAFYRDLGPVPVPLATLPVAAFVLLGVYGRLWVLIVSAVVLGVGHVGIHLAHRGALRAAPA
jgi:hypothetical protein